MAKNFDKMAGKNSIIKQVSKKASLGEVKRTLPVDSLSPSPHNREIWDMNPEEVTALAEGIKRRGFEGTVGVYDLGGGRYEVYDGHMRVEAAKEAGLSEVPVRIKKEPEEKEKWDDLISSNMDGRKVTAVEKARALKAYKDHVMPKAKPADLGKHFGMGATNVTVLLNLNKCVPELQALAEKVNVASLSGLRDLPAADQRKLAGVISDRLESNIRVTGKDIERLAFNIRAQKVEIKVKEHTRKPAIDWSDMEAREEGDAPLNERIPTELEMVCRDAIVRLEYFENTKPDEVEKDYLKKLAQKATDLLG